MMNYKLTLLALTAVLINAASAFMANGYSKNLKQAEVAAPSPTMLQMASDDDLLRWARTSRSAGANDNVVELMRPIGVVLAEDDNGNVFVETLGRLPPSA